MWALFFFLFTDIVNIFKRVSHSSLTRALYLSDMSSHGSAFPITVVTETRIPLIILWRVFQIYRCSDRPILTMGTTNNLLSQRCSIWVNNTLNIKFYCSFQWLYRLHSVFYEIVEIKLWRDLLWERKVLAKHFSLRTHM